MGGLVEGIRQNYRDCITQSLRENQCRLQLDALPSDPLVVIDGTEYQANRGFAGKLCDGILFWERCGLFVAAVELKGGGSIRLSDAIDQIQGGLTLASDILKEASASDLETEWVPLLLYSGSLHRDDVGVLRRSRVSFQRARRPIQKHDCGTRLSEILATGS